jgi:hypothetical protein
MDYSRYVSDLAFNFLQPDSPRGQDGYFHVARASGRPARLLELPESAPADVHNTHLPITDLQQERALRKLCEIPRMATFAVGALINRGVAQLQPGSAFVNVGVWNGFSFLSGLVRNPGKTCIGIDNFSQFGGPRDDFMPRFEPFESAEHRFYDMDYQEYFAEVHREPIGLYLYDGAHSYDNQLKGLEIAEPFFADDCIVVIDDTNWIEPRRATADFVDRSKHSYEVLLDRTTSTNAHPTLWNGLIVLRRLNGARSGASTSIVRSAPDSANFTPGVENGDGNGGSEEPAFVSVVVHQNRNDTERLRLALEACLNQSWPNFEVLVADGNDRSHSSDLVDEYRARGVQFTRGDRSTSALARATELTGGSFIAFVDLDDPPLRATAVEMALGFPERFKRGLPVRPGAFRWMEKALEAKSEIQSVVPEDATMILLHEQLWNPDLMLPRRVLPFLERDGVDWGKPADDATAIAELKRMQRLGATYIAFAWPAFWWLDHYSGFREFLHLESNRLIENERVVVFGLRN